MFLWRFTWGLGCFNVLTSKIVFTWVVIRLKVIVAIFATFLSTELYTFEVPVISEKKTDDFLLPSRAVFIPEIKRLASGRGCRH